MALRFPNEDAKRRELSERLPEHFSFANRLLRYWLTTDKDTGFHRSNLSPIVLRVVLAMSVKATRQFRSVIELCQRAESVDAAIIARSMFETSVVVGFVLKPRFTPREFDRTGKVTQVVSVPGRRLTREFRSLLFVTHHVLQPQRSAARRHRVYGSQSEHVHAADMLHHMTMDDEATTTPVWHETVEYVRAVLQTGITMFYVTIAYMNDHIGFGVGMNTALHGFSQEYKQLVESE